ncbi:hybrid sensor histidine kinase/response regulator [Mesosutterella sp. AGMB02718]|uniref:histidine kinase n=1 Tax=Mesosutterella faecium TaxID=2925194 RepID=A0ABT7IQF1_9BURK|nr:hybrid sensor histidine kinase/response regulator [Mesosutterella sp. AGMB02718]MDL2059526.1 hybrid sensor histidine kinase/response regulator [Mesosutterella sp. AGMB02718]
MGAKLNAFRSSVRRVFGISGGREALAHRTSRVLAQQLERAMNMIAVPLILEGASAALLIFSLWEHAPRLVLLIWGSAVALSIAASIEFYRRFMADKARVARIRFWLRAQMAHSVITGLLWGAAGSVFPFFDSSVVSLVSPVTAVVVVALGSWPFYAMWLPGLSVFSLLSLGTTGLSLIGSYFFTNQLYATVFFLALIAVILYSGLKLNELMTSSILAESENRKLLQRLERERNAAEAARREAEEGSRRRADFFRAANHDLRQPLQAMGIYLQILRMKKTPDTAPAIEQLSVCAGSISTLVEQILELSRMTADDFTVHRELVSVPELLRDLAGEFAPVAAEKGVGLSIRPLELRIDTDRLLVSRALRNLVSNAIKYCSSARPEGGEVIVAARRCPAGRVRICVYDNGPGIPREEREKVFHSFYRGSAGRSGPGGYGLGLAIVSAICRRLGIGLSVGSLLGRGTVFRMEFGAAERTEPAGVAPAGRAAGPEPVQPLPRRVLFLEDNSAVRRSVSELLRSWGAEVVAEPFFSPQLVERMKAFKPEVLLTDYDLGEGVPNGIDSCLTLAHELRTPLPAVVLTAVPDGVIEEAWRERLPTRGLAEMPEILQKPAGEAELNSALRRACESGSAGSGPRSQAPLPDFSRYPS